MAQGGISPTFIDDVIQFHPPGPRRKVSVTSCFNPFFASFFFFFFFFLFFSFFLFSLFRECVSGGEEGKNAPNHEYRGDRAGIRRWFQSQIDREHLLVHCQLLRFLVSLSLSLSLVEPSRTFPFWNISLFWNISFSGIFPFLEYFLFWSISLEIHGFYSSHSLFFFFFFCLPPSLFLLESSSCSSCDVGVAASRHWFRYSPTLFSFSFFIITNLKKFFFFFG